MEILNDENKKKLSRVMVNFIGGVTPMIIIPGKEKVRNDFEIMYGSRCLWVYKDKKVTEVIPFETITFISFSWKPEENKCPECKGTGFITVAIRMGDDTDVQQEHCPECTTMLEEG